MKLASIFTDHMVLQADKPIKIFGTGAGNLMIDFLNSKIDTVVTEQEWCVTLPAKPYGGPYEMHIYLDGEDVFLKDIYVGEVWLACGQSNMTMPLFKTEYGLEDAEHAYNEKIRLFTVPRRTKKEVPICGWQDEAVRGEDTTWQICTEESALHFSAIGYYVAKQLQTELQVAVGVISCNWGGIPIETMIDRAYFDRSDYLKPALEQYHKMLDALDEPAYEKAYAAAVKEREAYYQSIGHHEIEKIRKKGVRACIGGPDQPEPELPNGPYLPNQPGCLYDAMLSRIAPFAAQGVLWYQGESNHCDGYLEKYLIFMQCVRDAFENPDLHFCAAELASYGYCNDPGAARQNAENRYITENNMALTREQQQKATEVGYHNYLATNMELGAFNDIHPIHKKMLARRMTWKILKHVYGFDILADHPVMDHVTFEQNKVYVHLRNAQGLYSKYLWAVKMYIADESHELKRAQIEISGDTLILSSVAVEHPVCVRYAFDSYYQSYHIYNEAGLPLAPFRADL